jgi:hypothetical protein
VTELEAIIRRNADAARERGLALTLTSFLMKAAALALAEHPTFNASLDAAAGELIVKRYCHLGVAVATERGLIVPVIRDVDQKPLVELQKELATLAQRVREGKATLEDLARRNLHDHEYRRARRHRRDSDHQLSGGGHPRGRPGARGGGGAGRPDRAAHAPADLAHVRPSRGGRRRWRPVRDGHRSATRAPRAAAARVVR